MALSRRQTVFLLAAMVYAFQPEGTAQPEHSGTNYELSPDELHPTTSVTTRTQKDPRENSAMLHTHRNVASFTSLRLLLDKLLQPDEMGITQQPKEMGITQQPPAMGVTQQPQKMGTTQHPPQMGITQQPQEMGTTQQPQEMGITQQQQEMGITQQPPEMGITQQPQEMGITQQTQEMGSPNKSLGFGRNPDPPKNEQPAILSSSGVSVISGQARNDTVLDPEQMNALSSPPVQLTSSDTAGVHSLSESGGRTEKLNHSDCHDGQHLMEPHGTVHWNRSSNSFKCSWVISLNPSCGVVLRVDEVCLEQGEDPDSDDTLTVYQGSHADPEMMLQRLTGDHPSISEQYANRMGGPVQSYSVPVTVVVIPSNKVSLHVITNRRDLAEGHKDVRDPTIKFSYTAIPLNDIPPKLADGRYNCSPPHVIPTVLRCDLVRQCAGGEDEDFDCAYNNTVYCGRGLLKYHSECYRLMFPGKPILPNDVETECLHLAKVGFNLLTPLDPVLLTLASRVTTLSGYEGLVINAFKVRTNTLKAGHLFRFLWAWTLQDTRTVQVSYGEPVGVLGESHLNCGVVRHTPWLHIQPVKCATRGRYAYVCVHLSGIPSQLFRPKDFFQLLRAQQPPDKFPTKQCANGIFTQPFHPCPVATAQNIQLSTHVGTFPQFQCDNGVNVHYSLTCDGIDDCGDNSDEYQRCWMFKYPVGSDMFQCRRQTEWISASRRCDGRPDCQDSSDEELCTGCSTGMAYCEELGCVPLNYTASLSACSSFTHHDPHTLRLAPLARIRTLRSLPESGLRRIDLDGYGMATVQPLTDGQCPETHFRCKVGVCIPVYLVNNGQGDCPSEYPDDEEAQILDCPGYYRCYRHDMCLHNDYLCDGVYQCPLKDDERYCNLTCPPGCTCEGLALTCNQTFAVSSTDGPRWARYVDLSGVTFRREPVPKRAVTYPKYISNLLQMWHLQFLNLSSCGLYGLIISEKCRLKVLDLSFNHLKNFTVLQIRSCKYLTHLYLSKNPMVTDTHSSIPFISLRHLDIHNIGISYLSPGSFSSYGALRFIDIRGNRIRRIDQNIFTGLQRLDNLHTDDPRLCCTFFHDNPNARTVCHAPDDELSSCDDLLRSDFFRGFLWTLSVLAITGNMWVLIYRLCLEALGTSRGFRIQVANLCVSDFLMGVYLLIIGSADVTYRGQYLWKHDTWTQSVVCKLAGVLALVSSEVSALLVCIITVDRLLVLRFPLKRHLHLTPRYTALACGAAWIVGVTLAAVPLLPVMTDGQFYSQTAICLPLPITLRKFPGQQYAFGVFIVFNLVLFLAISCGQLLIYQAVNDTREAADTHRHQQDVAIARRLFLIVFSDFCCWFPIGVMGILAERGTPLPSVVNVWAAIFMLPLNSAINPFLYTLNTMLERRRKRKEEARVKAMLAKLHAELVTWPPDRLQELVHRGQRLLTQAKGREYVVNMTEAGFIQVVKDVQEVGKKILLAEASKEGESDTANCDSTTQADQRETELEERLQTLDQLCQQLLNVVPTSNTISDKGFQRPDNTSHKDF